MKKINIFFLMLIVVVFFTQSNPFGQLVQVCIDPGHGGPGASKYGSNGDGQGTDGPLPDGTKLSEEWVNLQVALALRDSIDKYCGGNVSMTRTTDTQYVLLADRVDSANFADCDVDPRPEFCAADEFIPIHHNGLPLDSQGVETFWCNHETVVINSWEYPRNNTNLLAQKIFWRLRDKFTYPPYSPRGCKVTCYYVLDNTTMASCYSEGTNMHNEDEAILFDDPNLVHVKEEADAIFRGWRSYYENNGIVTVDVRGLCDAKYKIIIDGVDKECPFQTSWTFSDLQFHTICAYESFLDSCGASLEYFILHHVEELETGTRVDWPPYNCLSMIVDPTESTHTFVAYYTGGPYSADLFMPDGGEEWPIGDEQPIMWSFFGSETSVGVDSSTLIDVYLDRHGGAGGYQELLFNDLPRKIYPNISWTVTGPASTQCRMKIVAQDCAGNNASDSSTYDFIIRFPNIVGDANSDGSVSNSDVVYLINYLFHGGPPPDPYWKGEVNGDCNVSLSDIVYLINYLFKEGLPPVPCNVNCGWDCQI